MTAEGHELPWGTFLDTSAHEANNLDFSVTSISKSDPPHSSPGLLYAKPWQVAMIGLGTAATQLDTSVNIAFPAITRGFTFRSVTSSGS